MDLHLLYLISFATIELLMNGSSAINIRDAMLSENIDLWEEAKEAIVGGYTGVRFNLAPSYGRLNSRSLRKLDKALKVTMGGILKLNLKSTYNWWDIKRSLDHSPLTVRKPKDHVLRTRRIHFNSFKVLGIGKSKAQRNYMIQTWFTNLIGNADILKDTHIRLDRIVELVSKFSVNMWTKLFTVKSRKISLMDLGILRFPDASQPFFTLYRMNLLGKCTYKTYIFYQEESSDVVGIFQKEVYYPNRDYIKRLTGDVTKDLVSEIENLFKN